MLHFPPSNFQTIYSFRTQARQDHFINLSHMSDSHLQYIIRHTSEQIYIPRVFNTAQ